MKRHFAVVFVFLLFGSHLRAENQKDCHVRPDWCRTGFTCEPTSCTARSAAALEGLMQQLSAARAERPRWFRPFAEGGLTWLPAENRYGIYGEGGVLLWRHLSLSGQVTEHDARARVGWRREW